MSVACPLIHARLPVLSRLGWRARFVASLISLGLLAVLAVAASVAPDPRGFGTHERLGMQSCGFLLRTGIPCPTCGATTAFAHFVRGQWLASFRTQPLGFGLALASAAGFWGAGYVAATGRPAHRLLRIVPLSYYGWSVGALALVAWAWKILACTLAKGV